MSKCLRNTLFVTVLEFSLLVPTKLFTKTKRKCGSTKITISMRNVKNVRLC